ncbi:MAG: hypothetical protein PHI48_11645 [Bacteroidales bacterium]|nr:hypothetical protein [Bacteroidales bacterium]
MEKNKTEGLPPAGIKVFRVDSKSNISFPCNKASTDPLFIYDNITNSTTIETEGWRNENTDSSAGISYLGNSGAHAYGGFILDSINPMGVRKLSIAWSCRTVLARASSTNSMQMQYEGLEMGATTDYTCKYTCSRTPGLEQNTHYTLEQTNEKWYSSPSNTFSPAYQLRWSYYCNKKNVSSQSRISLDNLIVKEVLNATKQDGALTDPTIWSLGIPQKYENFVLNHNTTLNSAQSAGEVQVAPGKFLNLTPGSALSVRKLDLYSDDTYGTSEIVRDGGTLSVTDKVSITKTLPEKGKWYFISFPFDVCASGIKSFDIGDETTTEAGNHLYIKSYDSEKRATSGRSTGNWVVTPSPTDQSTILFEKNKGYLIAIDATSDTQEICFESSSSTTFGCSETISTSCYIHDNNPESVHTGWVLTGNPLLNNLQLNGKPSLIGLTPFAYYYNQETHTYDVFNMAENKLPFKPFEAFFVKATEHGEMCFTTATDTGSKSIAEQEKKCITLTIKSNENESRADKTVFQLTENGKSSFSQSEDAYKLSSLDKEMPQISSDANGIEVAVNTLPLSIDTIIPLTVYCPGEGEYTISSEGASVLKELILIDLQTNTSYDLLSNKEISFVAEQSDDHRFQLKIKGYPETTTENLKMNKEYDLSIQNESLHITNSGKSIKLHVADAQGRNLFDGNISSEFNLPLQGVSGLIIVTLKDEKQTNTYKLIIKNI